MIQLNNEKKSKEIIITNYKKQYLISRLENDRAIEMFLKSPDSIEIGEIYIGKVKNIVENIQAAFIEVSPGIIGYYSLKTNTQHLFTHKTQRKLCVGDEILVQVERGSIKSKAPVLTSRIQLQGANVVLLANYHFIGISKKIHSENVRSSLHAMAESIIAEEPHGIIFRTQSESMDFEAIRDEYRRLLVDYNQIMSIFSYRTCYSKLYSMPQNYLSYVHASAEDDFRILTDIPEIYESLINDKEIALTHSICELYTDISYPLIKLKSLETKIERAVSKHVWLRSGASLVIEATEALTAIDVNTSKTEIRKKHEEAFLEINIEAAHEVFKQIRLRNLSGIIIVDFINLSNKTYNEQLMSELRKLAQKDPVQTNVVDMTALGLVEITRKRTYRPFHEQIKEICHD